MSASHGLGPTRSSTRITQHSALSTRHSSWPLLIFLVAFGLRAVVAVALFAYGQATGNGGIFFDDEQAYRFAATALAGIWKGEVAPSVLEQQELLSAYLYLAAALTLVTGPSLVALKLLSAVFGAALAVVVYKLAEHVAGAVPARLAGLLAAGLPGLVFWSSLALKESFVLLCLALSLLAAQRFWRSGSPGHAALLLVALYALATVRHFAFFTVAALLGLSYFLQALAPGPEAGAHRPAGSSLRSLGFRPWTWHTSRWSSLRRELGLWGAILALSSFLGQGPLGFHFWNGVLMPETTAYRRLVGATGAETSIVAVPVPAQAEGGKRLPPAPLEAEPTTVAAPVCLAGPFQANTLVTTTWGSSSPRVARVVERLQDGRYHIEFDDGRSATVDEQALCGLSALGWQATIARLLPTPDSGLFAVLFAPLPWAARSLQERLLAPDMLLWYGLLLLAPLGLFCARPEARRMVSLLALLAIAFTIILALSEGNLGGIARHRGQVLLPVLILASATLERLRQAWLERERKSQGPAPESRAHA
ncbi:MAG: glycosyltransferase family 39 protein [Chloroflexi bacterium]|nr:glycosyltransferase family 39 protein [Chloroflexota bacterium]